MKRVTTLLALLLSLIAASIAIAAGGPGKFETKITGTSAKTANGMLDGTWVIDLANSTLREPQTDPQREATWRRQVRHLGIHDQAHAKKGRQVHDQGQLPVQAARQDPDVQGDQRHLHDP